MAVSTLDPPRARRSTEDHTRLIPPSSPGLTAGAFFNRCMFRLVHEIMSMNPDRCSACLESRCRLLFFTGCSLFRWRLRGQRVALVQGRCLLGKIAVDLSQPGVFEFSTRGLRLL